jgi:hypothetical protein
MGPSDLRTKLWVDAHIRQCFLDDYPAFVVNKGDPERGGIILKIDRFDAGISIYERAVSFEGDVVWRPREVVDHMAAKEFIDKRLKFDTDCWVIEIEDPKGRYELGETIEKL